MILTGLDLRQRHTRPELEGVLRRAGTIWCEWEGRSERDVVVVRDPPAPQGSRGYRQSPASALSAAETNRPAFAGRLWLRPALRAFTPAARA